MLAWGMEEKLIILATLSNLYHLRHLSTKFDYTKMYVFFISRIILGYIVCKYGKLSDFVKIKDMIFMPPLKEHREEQREEHTHRA